MIQRICNSDGLKTSVLVVFLFAALLITKAPARADLVDDCSSNLQSSGIAWTGNSVVVVASASSPEGGNLYYFWQPAGAASWQKQLVAGANNGTCPGDCTGWCPLTPWGYESNAIAWTGDSVVIAAVDRRNGGLYYWFQPRGRTQWFQETIAEGPPGCCQFGHVQNGQIFPTVIGYSTPSIAWTGRSVVVAACDQLGILHYWYQNKFTSQWNHEVIGLQACSGQPVIAWTGQSVVIAANGALGLTYYWQAEGSRVWNTQYLFSQAAASSIAWTGSAVAIAAYDYAANEIEYFWQAQGTTPWHMQQVFGQGANDQYQDDFSSASIAVTGQSVVLNAGVNVPYADRLNYAWEPLSSTNAPSWSLENASLAGTGVTDYSVLTGPRAIAWTGKSVVMTSTTACGDLDYWWQREGAAGWTRERIVTNPGWPPGTC